MFLLKRVKRCFILLTFKTVYLSVILPISEETCSSVNTQTIGWSILQAKLYFYLIFVDNLV